MTSSGLCVRCGPLWTYTSSSSPHYSPLSLLPLSWPQILSKNLFPSELGLELLTHPKPYVFPLRESTSPGHPFHTVSPLSLIPRTDRLCFLTHHLFYNLSFLFIFTPLSNWSTHWNILENGITEVGIYRYYSDQHQKYFNLPHELYFRKITHPEVFFQSRTKGLTPWTCDRTSDTPRSSQALVLFLEVFGPSLSCYLLLYSPRPPVG